MSLSASLLDLAPPPTMDIDGFDDEFVLDLRVAVDDTALAPVRCPTDDNCGSTCAPSACSTSSNNPS
jgi:FxLD family lantipeptide